ncbi:putative nuclease HARBI1 isoform X2 [Harpegnathos saltator]|uniref:putative nuclease HARBI1 isoform X2 n=1 Tax=Harpegnathos saltator TaxID=610380 RepID=UPI000DBEE3A4|nr:putative nuclease HARBI1 isoform X2 [Harpegnathos saltator]
MIISDYNGVILAVKANHGGCTHDVRVWASSQLSAYMLREHENGRRNVWLIVPGSPGALYTDCHIRARFSVERAIGVLKGRWRYLRKERALNYVPKFAAWIVNATCVLHNIAKQYNVPEDDVYREDDIEEENIDIRNNNMVARGNAVRERIIQIYFN